MVSIETVKEVKISKEEVYNLLKSEYNIPSAWIFDSFAFDSDETFFMLRYKVV